MEETSYYDLSVISSSWSQISYSRNRKTSKTVNKNIYTLLDEVEAYDIKRVSSKSCMEAQRGKRSTECT